MLLKNHSMKIVSFLIIFFVAINLNAQHLSDYYSNKKEISGNGYIYTINKDKYSDYLIIQRKNNVKSNLPWYYKGTTEYADVRWAMYAIPIDNMIIYNIFKEVFTEAEINSMKKEEMNYYKNTFPKMDIPLVLHFDIHTIVALTGEVEEVVFSFKAIQPYVNIHPDKLYSLENKIKERISFKILDILKDRFNYIKAETLKINIDNL